MLHLRIVDDSDYAAAQLNKQKPQLRHGIIAVCQEESHNTTKTGVASSKKTFGECKFHNEPPSPIGPLIADAPGEGYTRKAGVPFHGYIFRSLTRQGPAARGGARDYKVNGVMTRGIAFVAYPAVYRTSGVMTFIINQDGRVFEKDLGQDTVKVAEAMSKYNPDKTWMSAK